MFMMINSREQGGPIYSENTDEGLTIGEIIAFYIEENLSIHLVK